MILFPKSPFYHLYKPIDGSNRHDEMVIAPYLHIENGAILDAAIATINCAQEFVERIMEWPFGADQPPQSYMLHREVIVGGWYVGPHAHVNFIDYQLYKTTLPDAPSTGGPDTDDYWIPDLATHINDYPHRTDISCCCALINGGTITGFSIPAFGGNIGVGATIRFSHMFLNGSDLWNDTVWADEYDNQSTDYTRLMSSSFMHNIFYDSVLTIDGIDAFGIDVEQKFAFNFIFNLNQSEFTSLYYHFFAGTPDETSSSPGS